MYALFEGAFIGGISARYNFSFSKNCATEQYLWRHCIPGSGLTFCVVIGLYALIDSA